VLRRSGFSPDKQLAAKRVNDRAEERPHDETLDTTTAAAGTQKRYRPAAITLTTPPARSSYPGIPDPPGQLPGVLGSVLGRSTRRD
jgi:hypothetical protein